jgi:hypothetical protein
VQKSILTQNVTAHRLISVCYKHFRNKSCALSKHLMPFTKFQGRKLGDISVDPTSRFLTVVALVLKTTLKGTKMGGLQCHVRARACAPPPPTLLLNRVSNTLFLLFGTIGTWSNDFAYLIGLNIYLLQICCCRTKNTGMQLKKKTVPLHAMEAHGGRGGIAPTHS